MTARLALVLDILLATPMRNRFLSCFSAVAILLAAGAAQAGVLTSASWVQTIDLLPWWEPIPISRTTQQLGASGTATRDSIAVSLSYPLLSARYFYPKSCCTQPLDAVVLVSQGGPQAITATPSMGGADQGIPGTGIVRTAIHNTKGVNRPGIAGGSIR